VCVGAERVWGVDATLMVSFQIVGPGIYDPCQNYMSDPK
jgi:hypothetical protein